MVMEMEKEWKKKKKKQQPRNKKKPLYTGSIEFEALH